MRRSAAPTRAEEVADAVAYLRHCGADLVVSYDDDGGYGHPDHVRMHDVAKAAADELGLPFAALTTDRDKATRWFDLTGYLPRVASALRNHRTQLIARRRRDDHPLRGPDRTHRHVDRPGRTGPPPARQAPRRRGYGDDMRLILIRHGQTDANVRRQLDTAYPGLPLNETGHAQAKALVDAISHERIDAIYCSTLTRAQRQRPRLAAARGLDAVIRRVSRRSPRASRR